MQVKREENLTKRGVVWYCGTSTFRSEQLLSEDSDQNSETKIKVAMLWSSSS